MKKKKLLKRIRILERHNAALHDAKEFQKRSDWGIIEALCTAFNVKVEVEMLPGPNMGSGFMTYIPGRNQFFHPNGTEIVPRLPKAVTREEEEIGEAG